MQLFYINALLFLFIWNKNILNITFKQVVWFVLVFYEFLWKKFYAKTLLLFVRLMKLIFQLCNWTTRFFRNPEKLKKNNNISTGNSGVGSTGRLPNPTEPAAGASDTVVGNRARRWEQEQQGEVRARQAQAGKGEGEKANWSATGNMFYILGYSISR